MSVEPNQSTPSLKKENSYTYWVDSNNKSRQLPEQHRPKKIDPPPIIQNNSTGPSKWNTSGTWQQRTILLPELNSSTQQQLKKYLSQTNNSLELIQVNFQGEFKQVFSNNKRKLMYQISGKIKFRGQDLYIKLKQLSCYGDKEYQVKGKDKQQRQMLGKCANEIIEVVLKCFNRYKE